MSRERDRFFDALKAIELFFCYNYVQAFVCNPKQDLHGLGYDPFKHAPEFRGM